MQPTPPWRQIMIEQLQMLASEAEQLEYERNVPHVDITNELVCGWFGDSYHPDNDNFRACFTDDELVALQEFDALLDKRQTSLPKNPGTVTAWLKTPEWREVMNAALQTLRRIAA